MDQIQRAIEDVHEAARKENGTVSVPQQRPEMVPFARINSVDPGSAAELAGLEPDDLLLLY
jgi:hypothetical protein